MENINHRWTTAYDGIDKLTLEKDHALPDIASFPSNHVLVKIHAVSLNYRDVSAASRTLLRAHSCFRCFQKEVVCGEYGHHKGMESERRLVPCSDAAGEISEQQKSLSVELL